MKTQAAICMYIKQQIILYMPFVRTKIRNHVYVNMCIVKHITNVSLFNCESTLSLSDVGHNRLRYGCMRRTTTSTMSLLEN